MSRKFDTIIESVMQRYQGTNFLVGDRVKFTENHTSHPWFDDKSRFSMKSINQSIH